MLVRCLRQHQHIWLIITCVSVYVSLKATFMYHDLIREQPRVLSGSNDSALFFRGYESSTASTPLPPEGTQPPYPPTCPVDYLGVPTGLRNPECEKAGNCLNITCRDLLFGDNKDKSGSSAYDKVKEYMKNHPKVGKERIFIKKYFNWTSDCYNFKQIMGYVTKPLSSAEADFPIAYNILIHRDVEQIERLLRIIYRPQNSYCFHVDAKAPTEFLNVMHAIANCFDNVFIASRLEKIVYAGYSRLQADINCMKDHLSRGTKWKYLLNLAGQAFPLKTNAELVQILKIYNGANDIEGIFGPRVHRSRFENEFVEIENRRLEKTGKKNPPPPHDIDIVRGSAYGVFSRDFVNYIVNDQKAIDLLEWSKTTYSPDEHYWATLHHTYTNPHLHPPGGYSGNATPTTLLCFYS